MKKVIAVAVLAITLVISFTATVFAYPNYDGYINDYADILTDEQEQQLEIKLGDYDKKTSTQIAVAIVQSLEGEDIDSYSINLADKWAPGQEEKDNGIILLIAMEEREMRIEVGYGLEGDVTDIEAKHIIDDTIVPNFKSENYYQGIDAGTSAIISSIETEFVNEATPVEDFDGSILLILIIVFVVFVVFIIIVNEPGSSYSTSSYSGYTPRSTYRPSTFTSTPRSSYSSRSPSISSTPKISTPKITFGGGGFGGGGAKGKW